MIDEKSIVIQQPVNHIGELLQGKHMARTQLAQKLGYSVSHISADLWAEGPICALSHQTHHYFPM